jgi:hypothetical protein
MRPYTYLCGTVIVDIDGTLADLSHRLHHVRNGGHNWDEFFAGVSGGKKLPNPTASDGESE